MSRRVCLAPACRARIPDDRLYCRYCWNRLTDRTRARFKENCTTTHGRDLRLAIKHATHELGPKPDRGH